jgi:hypothetical protein
LTLRFRPGDDFEPEPAHYPPLEKSNSTTAAPIPASLFDPFIVTSYEYSFLVTNANQNNKKKLFFKKENFSRVVSENIKETFQKR